MSEETTRKLDIPITVFAVAALIVGALLLAFTDHSEIGINLIVGASVLAFPKSMVKLTAVLLFVVAMNACVHDGVQLVYKTTVEACYQKQRAIIRREGTTREEDEAAITAIREDCDNAYAGLEAAGRLLDSHLERDTEEP